MSLTVLANGRGIQSNAVPNFLIHPVKSPLVHMPPPVKCPTPVCERRRA